MSGEPVMKPTHKVTHSLHIPSVSSAEAEPLDMESLQELIPFAREMLSQKPTRGLLRVYLVGTVFAVLGTVIGLVEIVCHPFSSGESMGAEMLAVLAREQRTVEAETLCSFREEEEKEEEKEKEVEVKEEQEEEKEEEVEVEKAIVHKEEACSRRTTLSKARSPNQRNIANRLHAS